MKNLDTFKKWIIGAIVLALFVFALVKIIPPNDKTLPESEETSVRQNALFGRLDYYDSSEIVDNNPWTETAELTSLPVFKNTLVYDESFYKVINADYDQMEEFLLDIAGRWGMDINSLKIEKENTSDKEIAMIKEKFESIGESIPDGYLCPNRFSVEKDGIRIVVDAKMTADISFDPYVPLPKEYTFARTRTYEEVATVAEYLKEEYKDFLSMVDPRTNISGGDYYIDLTQRYILDFYEGQGNYVSQIINYNFNRSHFYIDENGGLRLAGISKPNLSDKVGDFPVITVNEAKSLLDSGEYLTTVPGNFPGLEFIGKYALIYPVDYYAEYFVPHYEFYVELPDITLDNGLKAFGVYYVPAIEKSYLKDIPAWQPRFN